MYGSRPAELERQQTVEDVYRVPNSPLDLNSAFDLTSVHLIPMCPVSVFGFDVESNALGDPDGETNRCPAPTIKLLALLPTLDSLREYYCLPVRLAHGEEVEAPGEEKGHIVNRCFHGFTHGQGCGPLEVFFVNSLGFLAGERSVIGPNSKKSVYGR